MTVRRMRSGDIRACLELWRATEHMGISGADSPGRLRRFLARNRGLSRVAVIHDDHGREALVGSLIIGHDGRRGYLYHLAVHHRHRRQGIARRLVTSGIQALQRDGIERCHLMLFSDNETGRSTWRRLGWTERTDIAIMSRDIPVSALDEPRGVGVK